MKIGSFEFNLRELAGSLGDFGTLLPLTIGCITVCKMDPAGLAVHYLLLGKEHRHADAQQ